MRSSIFIAGTIAVAVGAWLASPYVDVAGLLSSEPSETASQASDSAAIEGKPAKRLQSVRVETKTAEPVVREVVVDGHTEPDRMVEIKAEVSGAVTEVMLEKGAEVAAGETILEIDRRDREANVKHAEALLKQREIEREAARRLGEKGFQAETRVAEYEALFEQAQAELEHARIQLDDTVVRAPFVGTLDDRYMEIGDYLDIGDPIAMVIDIDPLIVVADVPETVAGLVRPGMAASVRLVSGLKVDGQVSFVATKAAEATRTFRVEIEVENSEGRYPAGVSASVTLRMDEIPAHKVSSGLLVLNDQGELGIRTVDDDNIVRFMPAKIVRSEADAVWLQGLPESARIITVGQGFVSEGQEVSVIDATASTPVARAGESAAS